MQLPLSDRDVREETVGHRRRHSTKSNAGRTGRYRARREARGAPG